METICWLWRCVVKKCSCSSLSTLDHSSDDQTQSHRSRCLLVTYQPFQFHQSGCSPGLLIYERSDKSQCNPRAEPPYYVGHRSIPGKEGTISNSLYGEPVKYMKHREHRTHIWSQIWKVIASLERLQKLNVFVIKKPAMMHTLTNDVVAILGPSFEVKRPTRFESPRPRCSSLERSVRWRNHSNYIMICRLELCSLCGCSHPATKQTTDSLGRFLSLVNITLWVNSVRYLPRH